MTGLVHSNLQTVLLKQEVEKIVATVPEPKSAAEAARLRKEFEYTRDGRVLANQQKENFFTRLQKTCDWLRGGGKEG